MNIKPKPCKAINKAKGFESCDKETLKRVYGLCSSCYAKWLYTTDEGKAKIERCTPKQTELKTSRNKKTNNPEVYSSDLKSTLQKEINHIARLIDNGGRCVDCKRTEANPCWDGGHFNSRGSEPKLRYNLHNIFKQTRYCNSKSEGNKMAYYNGLKDLYGLEYAEKVNNLPKSIDVLKLPNSDLPNKIKEARKIVRELKSLDMVYSPKVRIELRQKYNKRIGIY